MSVLGLALGGLRDPVRYLERQSRRGDVVRLKGGRRPVFLVSHPDLVRTVLESTGDGFLKGSPSRGIRRQMGNGILVSGGPHHDRQRALLEPLFARKEVVDDAGRAVASATRMATEWHDGDVVDVVADMRRMTTRTVVGALVPETDPSEVDRVTEALTVLAHGLWRGMVPFSAALERGPFPGFRRTRRAREAIDSFVREAIRRRGANAGNPPLGILSEMLAERDDEGRGMTPEEARDEAFTLLLAGRGTITAALAWTWYVLARNEEVEARVVEEAGAASLPDLTAQDLQGLSFTGAVFSEALRAYPPSWVLPRRVGRDVDLGGHRIPRGSTVLVSQFVVHHDERWWPDPERLDPKRFVAGGTPGGSAYAWFPFGGGPRGCIGAEFATMEATLAIATLVRRWRLRPLRGAAPPRFARSITLRPRRRLLMRVEARR